MKKILFCLLAGTAAFSSSLVADVDFQDIGSTEIDGLKEDDSRGPFKVEFVFDAIGDAKVKDGHHKLQFATAEAEISAVFYHNACYSEGASIGLSYNRTRFDWRHSHYFHQKDFDQVCLTLGFSSERLCDWLWQAQVSANFDNIEHWSFNDYMNYDMLIWGRYAYNKTLGIHLGVLATAGMKIDRVYPIIGVDWQWSDSWKINLIFPVNLSLVYNFNKAWSVALAGRVFYERHRLGKNEFLSKGLIEYRTAGVELGLNYNPKAWLSANIHAGYDLGGKFKTANRNYNHRHNYDIDGAPYAGAELDVAF